MRRAEVTDGSAVRKTRPVSEDSIDKIHAFFSNVQVELPRAKTTRHLRDLMRVIRVKRNSVGKVLGFLLRLNGSLKADLARVERIYDAERNLRYDRQDCFAGTTNDKQREARVRGLLSKELDATSSLEADLALVGEALSHGRLVLDEIRGAFDEASRLLSSIDLDWRVESGQR